MTICNRTGRRCIGGAWDGNDNYGIDCPQGNHEGCIYKEKIINLTQHNATPDQIEAGVEDLHETIRKEVQELLTFESLPSREEIERRAIALSTIATKIKKNCSKVLIGGAPFLMAPLERELKNVGITPTYAFSKRKTIEQTTQSGVVKTSVFKHEGFIDA